MLMLLVPDEPPTATSAVPEALIEEARELQRRRLKQRKALLYAVTVLSLVGFGIAQLAQGGSSGLAQRPAIPAASAARPAVLYEKIETVKVVSHLPIERQTIERWSTTDRPWVYRELVTTVEGRTVEIGSAQGHDKVLGAEQLTYLYLASSNTIYRTGTMVPPEPLRPKQMFRHILS